MGLILEGSPGFVGNIRVRTTALRGKRVMAEPSIKTYRSSEYNGSDSGLFKIHSKQSSRKSVLTRGRFRLIVSNIVCSALG